MATIPLPPANERPSVPIHHGHRAMEFEEPENREGGLGEKMVPQGKRKRGAAVLSPSVSGHGSITSAPAGWHAPSSQAWQQSCYGPWPGTQQLPGLTGWPYYQQYPAVPPPPPTSYYPSAPPPASVSSSTSPTAYLLLPISTTSCYCI